MIICCSLACTMPCARLDKEWSCSESSEVLTPSEEEEETLSRQELQHKPDPHRCECLLFLVAEGCLCFVFPMKTFILLPFPRATLLG